MELRKESIQTLRTKSQAATQVTVDMDFNVPDARPDIGRMIQNKGEVIMDEMRLADGHGHLKGTLQADLLYVEEGEGKVCSLTARLPLEESLNLEGIDSGDKMCLKWEIEDLSLRLIHSRKLNIKAIVSFYATVDELVGIQIPTGLGTDSEGVSAKINKIPLLDLCVHKKDTLRIKNEITLSSNKPNVEELLWNTTDVRGLELRPEENRIRASGELSVFVIYAADDEGSPLQWMEYSLPFRGEVECDGCSEELIPNIETSVIHHSIDVKPDADGEERILVADVVLELEMKLYREREPEVVLDLYTPLRECICRGKTEILERLLIRNFSRCRLHDRIPVKETQGKVLQFCHSQGRVKVDKTRIVENGIQAEGVILMKILYIISSDEMPFYSMEAMIPFTHVVEAEGISEECRYYLHADLEQLSTTMADSNEIEVKAAVGLNVLVLRHEDVKIISRVEEKPLDIKKIQTMPGITVYMVKPGDTLWDIAKCYYTTVEEIRDLNQLSGEEAPVGQPLMLVKKVL
ncbi:MAG: DUF3794 domain-containing protein [Clostridiales bacterium]|nr:DUF3794 domain-containing protein [Clostridiales bacterium]